MELYRKTFYAALGGFAATYLTILIGSLNANPEDPITLAMFLAPLRVALAAGLASGLGAWAPANKFGGQNVIDLAKKNARMTEPAFGAAPVDYVKKE